jgi:hypothetical protein
MQGQRSLKKVQVQSQAADPLSSPPPSSIEIDFELREEIMQLRFYNARIQNTVSHHVSVILKCMKN